MTTQAIFDAADTILAQRLSQIDGVAQANVMGAEKPAIRIQVDMRRISDGGKVVETFKTTEKQILTPEQMYKKKG